MTTKNKATPRPWRINGGVIDGAPTAPGLPKEYGPRVCGSPGYVLGDDSSRWEANAGLIVEAVNAYDAHRELVEAARVTLLTLENLLTDCGEGNHTENGRCCFRIGGDKIAREALRAALAKVEP